MTTTTEAKVETIANLIDGRIVDDSDRVAVCVKGMVEGFPATFEAIYTHWPFGVVYTVEINPVADPNKPNQSAVSDQITIYPRMGRGIASIFTRILLFEGSGMPVSDKRLEKVFNISYSDREAAERFLHHPGVSEYLFNLNSIAKFNELVIRRGVGIYLSQPNSFNAVDLDVCRNTFKTLGAMAKVLFEAF
jgi:hypothetical protein